MAGLAVWSTGSAILVAIAVVTAMSMHIVASVPTHVAASTASTMMPAVEALAAAPSVTAARAVAAPIPAGAAPAAGIPAIIMAAKGVPARDTHGCADRGAKSVERFLRPRCARRAKHGSQRQTSSQNQ